MSFANYFLGGTTSIDAREEKKTHRREIVEDVALRSVGEYDVSRDGHRGAGYEGHRSRHVCDCCKTVESRRLQASIDQ